MATRKINDLMFDRAHRIEDGLPTWCRCSSVQTWQVSCP